ncbi:MAG TPA: hypothetical protein VNA25_28435 [Phycisphaerae bacterium]|nr:hypothetical protein [Phycisphaerae bacterium]HUT61785.1 hypothetical protein [Phycisphaerae bacterium]
MRWISFLILAYVVLLIQTTLVRLVHFTVASAGTIAPDLLAMVAVFVAMHVRSGADVMLAAWALGLAADLTTGGGPNALPAVGVMPIAYALAAGMVYRLREAFFAERVSTKIVLALLFCLVAHGIWVTVQSLLACRAMTWSAYGQMLVQALGLSAYTAALMAPAHWVLTRLGGLFVAAPAGRARRYR